MGVSRLWLLGSFFQGVANWHDGGKTNQFGRD